MTKLKVDLCYWLISLVKKNWNNLVNSISKNN